MSTVAPGKRAHINTAYFAYSSSLELYFLSDPTSRHSKNLGRNASMAMTIFNSSQEWAGTDRGIQLFGSCRRTDGRQAIEAERWYGKRFPTYARLLKGTNPADRRQAALLKSYAFYRFLPNRIKVLDEREFGGAAFVIAAVKRTRRSKEQRRGAVVTWRAMQVPGPSAEGASERVSR